MATLSVIVPTPALSRIRKAFGHQPLPGEGSTWVDATQAEVEAELADYVKRKVRTYEEAQAAQTAVNAVVDIV